MIWIKCRRNMPVWTEQKLPFPNPRSVWPLSVDPKDVESFLGYAKEENLEAIPVAVVTEKPKTGDELERKDHCRY